MDEATREAVVRTLRDGLFDLGIDDVDDGELIDIAAAILALLSASAPVAPAGGYREGIEAAAKVADGCMLADCDTADRIRAITPSAPSADAPSEVGGELLPCPFCGSSDVHLRQQLGHPMSWVSCVSCGLEAPTETGVTGEQAVAYWNSRTPSTAALDRGHGCRPEVIAFASLMERQLRANDHKPGWKNDEPVDLMEHAASEIEELWKAVNDWMDHSGPTQVKYRDNVQREAADVANMVMMVADVCGALTPSAPSATCKEILQVRLSRTPPTAAPAGDVIDNIVRDVYELDGYTNTNDPDYLCLTVKDLRVILERQVAAPAGDDAGLRKLAAKFAREAARFTDATPDTMPMRAECIFDAGWEYSFTMGDLRKVGALSASPAPQGDK